jgi:hypothetical protein
MEKLLIENETVVDQVTMPFIQPLLFSAQSERVRQ